MFYSISAQRWYRIELKVLIITFSDKVLHVVLLEGTKENELVTCDSEREKVIASENVLSVKEWLEKKSTYGCWSNKRRLRNKKSFWEMSLIYSLSRRIHFEFNQSCDKSYMFNLTNVGLSMCVMEYSDLFLNLIWPNPDIYVWKKYEIIPAWRGKVGIVLILHGGRKLWWLMCWFIAHWEKSLELLCYSRIDWALLLCHSD